jgi:hypothetical protein
MRIVFLVGVLTTVVMAAAYSASIVSILSQKETPVKTFQSLLTFGYSFSGNTSTNHFQYFFQVWGSVSIL